MPPLSPLLVFLLVLVASAGSATLLAVFGHVLGRIRRLEALDVERPAYDLRRLAEEVELVRRDLAALSEKTEFYKQLLHSESDAPSREPEI